MFLLNKFHEMNVKRKMKTLSSVWDEIYDPFILYCKKNGLKVNNVVHLALLKLLKEEDNTSFRKILDTLVEQDNQKNFYILNHFQNELQS